MRITWHGHACFLIEGDGRKFLFDPFEPFAFGGKIGHAGYEGIVDFLISTHHHRDHFYVSERFGNPVEVRSGGTYGGVEFFSLKVPHDKSGGSERGFVNLFAFSVDGIRVCHPGDIGSLLSSEDYERIGSVDVLFLPVGGTFTIDADEARHFMRALSPKITIPMHFKYEKINLPIDGVDKFLSSEKYIAHKTNSLEITKTSLPAEAEIHLLTPP